MMKSKIAQQNRAQVDQSTSQQAEVDQGGSVGNPPTNQPN